MGAATIDNHADAGNLTAMLPNNVDGFLDPGGAGHDVLGDDEAFVRPNHESAREDKAMRC